MTGDPWAFQRWAFGTETGNPVRKAVLSMLAMMADASTGRCEARQATLAVGVEASERTVRGHLRALEDAGVIARRQQHRRDGSRRGDEYLLLAPGVVEWPDGEAVAGHPAGAAGATRHETTPPPGTKRPRHPAGSAAQELPLGTTTGNGRSAHTRDARDEVPDDFPDELRPHAREVLKILRDVAAQHGTPEPKVRAVARAIMARPRKPLVRAAHDFASWAADPPRPIRDVVSSYRTWLDRERDLAAVERLGSVSRPGENGAQSFKRKAPVEMQGERTG